MNYYLIIVVVINYPITLLGASLAKNGIEKFLDSLFTLQNDILKVSQFQDHVENNVKVKNVNLFPPTIIKNVVSNVENKFAERIEVVNRLRNSVQDTYLKNTQWGHWFNCCLINENESNYDSNFNAKVRTYIKYT